MKKILFVFILVINVLLLSVPLFAQERIIDNAGILGADDKARLKRKIEDLASAYNFNLMILIEKSIGANDAIDYSWEFLDKKGLDGYSWDGCLFLQSTGGRDYAFTASGRGDKILNNTAYNKLENDVVNCLRQDDYAKAYEVFIDTWEVYLSLEAKGRNYNFFTQNNLYLVIGAWVFSIIIGLLVVLSWKAKMNTTLPKTEADTYVVPGSLALTLQSDRFLYSTITKTARAQSSSSGGSSSSRSSGGRSSRSGKY